MTGVLAIPTSVAEPLLRQGDSLALMRQLPAESIDACVDDPPAGIGFMGKTWDSFRHYKARTERGEEIHGGLDLLGLDRWQSGFVVFMFEAHVEAFRVLKPGAYMVTWALPRTQDLAGMALRLAGFDVVHAGVHLFGGGFPKSHNVSKALDKMAGAEREVVGTTRTHDIRGGNYGDQGASAKQVEVDITAPATDAAKRWDGYGTMLAPGHEIWHVSRKPTPLTYAKNVLEHGCGALNIDACRVPRGDGVPQFTSGRRGTAVTYGDTLHGSARTGDTYAGSWPRDVLLSRGGDQCPVEGIDRQSGVTDGSKNKAAIRRATGDGHQGSVYGAVSQPSGTPQMFHTDTGGASRYFTQFDERVYYGPKNHDRRSGLLHGDHKHPTPKHPGLMRWLQRLVVPTAKSTGGLPGVVLSRFLGSGTDGVAAVAEGLRFIGFELDEAHFAVAKSRIMAAIGSPEEAALANEQAPEGAQLGLL